MITLQSERNFSLVQTLISILGDLEAQACVCEIERDWMNRALL